MSMFKPKHVAAEPDDCGISAARVKELLATVDAEQAAAAAVEPVGQDAHQWGGRRRITRDEAEAIRRRMIGPWRRHFTLSERREFLELYEVIAEHEPMPIPTSPTHHAELLAARAVAKAAAAVPKSANRFIAAARVLLGAADPANAPAEGAEPVKPKATFFT